MSVEHIINQQHFKNHAANNEGVQLEAIKQSLVNEKVEEKKPQELILKMTVMHPPSKSCYLNNQKKQNITSQNNRSIKYKKTTPASMKH